MVTAIDIGENLLLKTKERAKVKTEMGDVLKLKYTNDSFDYVLCTEVIEHTDSPRRAMKEIVRVLKPGGKAIVTSPNKYWWPVFKTMMKLGIRKYDGVENWEYPWQLRKHFLEAGGTLIESRGFNLFYPGVLKVGEARARILDFMMINYLILGEKW